MATKSKNRIFMAVWIFLLTFGLSGLLALFTVGSHYLHRDYFHTPEFQSELNQFAGYLSMFEFNSIPIEEAKRSITVSEDDINEHRYRYGSLPEQIENIKAQYEGRIQEAMVVNNQEAVNVITAERDSKIEDITINFQSDEHVRPKVVKEKEQKIEEYFKEREKYRSEYMRYRDSITYYFKNNASGKVHTNIDRSESELTNNVINPENMYYVTDYTISRDSIFYGVLGNDELINFIYPTSDVPMQGQMAIAKNLHPLNFLMVHFKNYQKMQTILLFYCLASIAALILGVYFIKKGIVQLDEIEKWRPYYNKLPIDLRSFIFIITGFGALISIFGVNDQLVYIVHNQFDAFEMLIFLIVASFLWGLTFVQWQYLYSEWKSWQNIKNEWEKSLIKKAEKRMRLMIKKLWKSLKESFLNKTTGTQFFLLIAFVFGLGFASIMIFVHPVLFIFYMILLGVVGLPIVMIMIKRIGYFNIIVQKTNELAVGKLGHDLPIIGHSVFAILARNINTLKQGVKTSQNEQAKSERLKTELITNVSHDLRTPLTSIITYTELLKTGNVSKEDRTAYLEIIDRKSKRLKVLIDDLFEVSKMASGNIELTKEKVDLVQLLQQALAEHDDTIMDSSLHFRFSNIEKPVNTLVDGQKLWRVFDNLIGNILKYSLENTRVYISIHTLNGQAMISFKNISKYELSENIDELFERFKRGDVSRHTEGSGLGLAIAKSIIDLHEGKLDIEVDGDLFKVTISLKIEETVNQS